MQEDTSQRFRWRCAKRIAMQENTSKIIPVAMRRANRHAGGHKLKIPVAMRLGGTHVPIPNTRACLHALLSPGRPMVLCRGHGRVGGCRNTYGKRRLKVSAGRKGTGGIPSPCGRRRVGPVLHLENRILTEIYSPRSRKGTGQDIRGNTTARERRLPGGRPTGPTGGAAGGEHPKGWAQGPGSARVAPR